MNPKVRIATTEDAEGILAIYNPCILHTAITYEEKPLASAQMRARMAEIMVGHPWLVCVDDRNEVLGYAYASLHGARAAYRWSVDVAIYTHPGHHRRGMGRTLYSVLLNILKLQGYVSAYAGISLPNPASVGLHEALGFKPAGVFPSAGFKLGEWRDVGWWYLPLAPRANAPAEPVSFNVIQGTEECKRLVRSVPTSVPH